MFLAQNSWALVSSIHGADFGEVQEERKGAAVTKEVATD